jgi:hypothetical protein
MIKIVIKDDKTIKKIIIIAFYSSRKQIKTSIQIKILCSVKISFKIIMKNRLLFRTSEEIKYI